MEAKIKAKELYDKMNVIHYLKLGGKNKNSKGLPVSMHNDQRKQCAIICVDEILKIVTYGTALKYWQQVKHEIQQL